LLIETNKIITITATEKLSDTFINKDFNKFSMKRLLIIPILIFVYIFFIDVISQLNFQEVFYQNYEAGGAGQAVSFGQAITVSVRRPYLFGLFYLPVYSESLGYIGGWHDAFFTFIFILAIALILLEFKHRKEIKGRKTKSNKRR